MNPPSSRPVALVRVLPFVVVLCAVLNTGTWWLGQHLALTVVPGWVKGPLIDPAAPYSPENAVLLVAANLCLVTDVYLIGVVLLRALPLRRWWFPWVVLGVALWLGEVGTRFWLAGHQLTYFRPHPVLHWQVRANLHDFPNVSGGGTVTTNADGMRNVVESREKAPDEFRVLVLGDSSNFGHGVKNEEVWSKVLDGLLRDRIPGKRVEVLNGACPGWTTYQAVEFMHLTGAAYHPDLVIAGFNNDPGPDYFGDKARVPTGLTRALDSVLWKAETYLLAREVVLSTVRRFVPEPQIHYIARQAGDQPNYGKLAADESSTLVPRVSEAEFLSNIHTLFEEGKDGGYSFAWIDMPINRAEPDLVDRYVNMDYRHHLSDMAKVDGFPIIDVDARWLRAREPELHIIGHVHHPSAKGHLRMAQQIGAEVLALGLLPDATGAIEVGGPPPAPTEATLRLGWSSFTPVHAHIGAVLEAHPELAAARGLQIELHPYASGKEQGDDVASGLLDAFFTCEVPAMQMVSSRTDLRLVATPGALGRVAVVANASQARTLADLAGKSVGFVDGATTAMDWAEWGRGLGAHDVHLKTDELETALADGRVAAVVAWDPWVEDMLRHAPGKRVILKERLFDSELAVSVPWATFDATRGRALVGLVADAMQIAAADRAYWDDVVARRSGWALPVVQAVAGRNAVLSGSVPAVAASLALTPALEKSLLRALGFAHLRDVGISTVVDAALLDGRVTSRRYSASAQFNPGSAAKPGPDGGPKGPPPPGGGGPPPKPAGGGAAPGAGPSPQGAHGAPSQPF